MKLPEVRDAVFLALAPLLPGWKLNKKEQAFIRQIDGGLQRVIVSVLDYRPEFRLLLAFATRLESVETLYHPFSGAKVADTRKLSNTSVVQLDYFVPGPKPCQYSIVEESDISTAVAALAPTLAQKIIPWLDDHRTLRALDAVLNGDDAAIDTTDPTHRAMHALIVAHLAGNPDFDQLVVRYQTEMSDFLDVLKQQVATVVEFLRKRKGTD